MTRVEVAADPVRARVRLSGDLLRPRLLTSAPAAARVALVPTTALLLGGDTVTVDVEVGDGAALELVEPGGTVAYPGPAAEWHVTVRLGRGAVLVWAGLPFVVCANADVRRTTAVHLADGARAVVRETVVLGRAGERGGALHQSTIVRHAGVELLVEELDLDPHRRSAPGVLGAARVLDTVAAYGFRPPPSPLGQTQDRSGCDGRLDLAGPGALARFVGDAAHHAALADTVERWSAGARADRRPERAGARARAVLAPAQHASYEP